MTTATSLIAAELLTAQTPCVTSSFQAECVVLVHPRHAGHAVTRHPDNVPIDSGVQIAAAAVLGVEAIQVGSAGSRPESVAQRGGVREGNAADGPERAPDPPA